MRFLLPLAGTLLALAAVSSGAAVAQNNPYAQNPGQAFQSMKPQDAARLNHAVQSDPQARQTLDHVEKKLLESGHASGHMLQKTRP